MACKPHGDERRVGFTPHVIPSIWHNVCHVANTHPLLVAGVNESQNALPEVKV